MLNRLPCIVIQSDFGSFEVGPDASANPNILMVRSVDCVLHNRLQIRHLLATVERGKGAQLISLTRPGRKLVTDNHRNQARAVAVWAAGLTWQDHGEQVRTMCAEVLLQDLDRMTSTANRLRLDLADALAEMFVIQERLAALGGTADAAQGATEGKGA